MNENVKNLWLAALRGDDYNQGRSALRTFTNHLTKYCCMGVLCDIHSQETNTPWCDDNTYLGQFAFLPEEVQEWAGLIKDNPWVVNPDGKNGKSTLAALNDTHRLDFSAIAGLIEKEF